eukprot:scaffold16879_cov90-Isochrysis_galbana.AAC.2
MAMMVRKTRLRRAGTPRQMRRKTRASGRARGRQASLVTTSSRVPEVKSFQAARAAAQSQTERRESRTCGCEGWDGAGGWGGF